MESILVVLGGIVTESFVAGTYFRFGSGGTVDCEGGYF